jgi:hypothetical protein
MVTLLAIVTGVSLVMTIALIVTVVRLRQEERQRSEARIAALAQMAALDEPADTIVGSVEQSDDAFDRLNHLSGVENHQAVRGAGDLFEVRQQRSAWPWRVGVVAAIALLATTLGLSIRVLLPETTSQSNAGARPALTATGQTSSAGLLELMSLKHAQQGDTLTITGLVQNPRDGTPLSKVTATAFLFSADGTFLASGRAPLDFTVLRPGDESGFVINVAVSGAVARYRVGFRSEDGRIIGHVDRRAGTSMARLGGGL